MEYVEDKDIPIDAEFVDNLLHDIYQTFEITDKDQQEKVKQNLPEYFARYTEKINWLRESTAIE